MARLLAVEWDQQEARFVLATFRRGKLTIERAVALALPPAAEGEKGEREPPAETGEMLRAALTAHRIRSLPTLVGVGRTSVELRQLTLPPAPAEELPELVRNLAMRELGSMSESALLDFVPLAGKPGEPQTVVAAAISAEQAAGVRATCAAAGIKPRRLLLRPYAAASLFTRQMHPGERTCLLVSCHGGDADLAVLVEGHVLISRTVRLPAHAEGESPHAPLLAEIRRTTVAVTNQPGGGSVEAIYVCGEAGEHRELVEAIQEELALAAEVFQPFKGLSLGPELRHRLPPESGRFAPLLGMLVDEAAGPAHAIDFLHPRQKPPPASQRRRAMIAAAAAAAVLFAGGYVAWSKFSTVNDEIARRGAQLKALQAAAKRAADKQTAVAAIEEWELGDVVWLDELRDLSLRFPKPRDAVVLRMTLAGKPVGGGAIELEGLVRDPSIVGRMENRLRDEYHEVRTKRVQESVQGATYTWKFDSSLIVWPHDKDAYRSHLPEVAAAAPSPDTPAASGDGRRAGAAPTVSKAAQR